MTDEQEMLDQDQTAVAEQDEGDERSESDKLKESIEVDVEEAGTLRKKLTITVPRDAIDERLNDQYAELKREAIVPGFRRGRAPLILVQKRFGDEVGDQILSQILSNGYLAAVDKVEIKPLGDPLIWITEKDSGDGEKLVALDKALESLSLPADGDFTFSCEVELRPEFELPGLDGIEVEKPTLTISDDDVTSEIDRLRSHRGRFMPVESGKVEKDDLVVVDLVVKVGDEVVNDEKNITLAARSQRIAGIVVEALGEKLVGKKIGDSVKLDTTVGDDHENADYRGKKASFAITVNDLKRFELPPIDDEFIESMGFDSEKEMRDQMRAHLDSQLESVIKRGMRGQIGKYLLEKTEMDVPPGVSNRQTDRLVARRKVELYQQGVSESEIEKQMDELHARASEDTIKELKLFFIMEKIAEEQEIEVSDDELNGAIASIAAQQGKRFDRVRDELSKGDGLFALYLQIRDDRILDGLLEKAVIKEVESPKKQSEAKSGSTKKTKKTKKTPKSAKKSKKTAKKKDD